MKKYRIRPLPIISMEGHMPVFTYRMNYDQKVKAPIYSWYIEGADKNIIVDTAVEAKFMSDFRGFETEEIQSFDNALASVGLKPDDIDIVIQTHLHYDHCGHTQKCKNAKVIVQEDEIKFALSPHPAMLNLYYRPFFKDLKFYIVQGRCEIVPGVEVIPVPGHSPGAQAVSVDTEKGKAIISGFCSIRLNFEPPDEVKEMWPVLTPGTHSNPLDAFDSALMIKGLADILIPQHEPAYLNVKSIP